MPFNSKSGADAVRSRWGDRDPLDIRNKQLKLTVSQREIDFIEQKAKSAGLTKTQLIIQAVDMYIAAMLHDEGHSN